MRRRLTRKRYEREVSSRAKQAQQRASLLSSSDLISSAEPYFLSIGQSMEAYKATTNIDLRAIHMLECQSSAEILVVIFNEIYTRIELNQPKWWDRKE